MQKIKDYVYYLSGPMTGLPEFNYPAFRKAAKELRELGFAIHDPSENDNGSTHRGWDFYIRLDIKNLMDCHAIIVLPGWEKSKGANLEVTIGRALGLPILSYPTLKPVVDEHKDESIIDEAKRLVGGDRQNAYGHPYHDFSRTAAMWNGLFSEKLKDGCKIEPEEVGMSMVLLKLSRHINKKKRDNLVDAHGYLLTVDMVEKYKQEQHA